MKSLAIGLVNNMPDPALEATERQFRSLLQEAAGDDIAITLSLHALPGVPRTDLGRGQMSAYTSTDDLWNRSLDGLVVTGAEPRSADLKDEPYWPDVAKLVDWAAQNTISTLWSCLAAHAAVLHLDGIRRRRLPEKQFGLFECVNVGRHFLTEGLPERLRVPHSRWNELREEELRAAGYEIVRRFQQGGVDAFVKTGKSLFVFLQGHPEYDASSLLLEYRRDVVRFLERENEMYIPMLTGYDDLLQAMTNTWHADAVRLYRNWLLYLAEKKDHPSETEDGRQRTEN